MGEGWGGGDAGPIRGLCGGSITPTQPSPIEGEGFSCVPEQRSSK
jgi:hypothetical protein